MNDWDLQIIQGLTFNLIIDDIRIDRLVNYNSSLNLTRIISNLIQTLRVSWKLNKIPSKQNLLHVIKILDPTNSICILAHLQPDNLDIMSRIRIPFG